MFDRIVRAIKLDRTLYRTVADDPAFFNEALIVVIVAAVLDAVGNLQGRFPAVAFIAQVANTLFFGWFLWAVVANVIGRALGGGVAYLNALCVFSIRYGLSANMAGYFPYPIQNNHPQNWDLMVVAYEIGHNFGAPHTHDMGIDYCAYGDCSVTPNGTIMSYCHLCSGGMANVRMEFHARTINEEMMPFIENEAPCNLVVVPPIFTVQPTNANPLCGATVVLHSEAVTLGPIVYRWRKNGVDLSDGPFVSGATTTTLTLTDVSEADSGNYVLSATSICEQTTTSAVAAVTPRCFLRGDCNCDGTIDNFDLDAFVLALINPLSFSIEYPQCDPLAADINGDGVVTNFDIDPFVLCLTSECP